ncbi:SMP-30/gluconolactonase/LRE family protein [Adhaeribacter swui]|uniref:SMP-30/gluconolactonase/LRE family protein n=1 Tax=Adhaeribacter swui TaxID=2086471 RepID=A0A7G7G579_9BACT|nr:L-dopachrome tautomerase-related protein [Adhaeribacter swui]QNF32313.1 SMP-30/gluconolactonase/LRE family protein [Adhaeribacter swui]
MEVHNTSLELLFADDTYQLTGVAISRDGRLFTNYPLWPGPYKYSVVEVLPDNQVKPYPNEEMNNWQPGDDGKNKWVCVQAVYIDADNFLWVVDPACPNMEQVYERSYKLVKFNLATDTIERVYTFEGVLSDKSYINDVRVDTQRQIAYLTNSNEGGLVVVDLQTGKARQLLQNHYSVKQDPEFTLLVDGKEFKKQGEPVHIHSDGIALSPDGEWLYYKPLTDNKLYRISTECLRNPDLSETELGTHVQDLGRFTTTDGMIFDPDGNLYLGDYQNYAMVQITPDLEMKTIMKDDRLIWPDSYSLSSDGHLYISCSQINKQPDYNEGQNKRTSPYTIYRMPLP